MSYTRTSAPVAVRMFRLLLLGGELLQSESQKNVDGDNNDFRDNGHPNAGTQRSVQETEGVVMQIRDKGGIDEAETGEWQSKGKS